MLSYQIITAALLAVTGINARAMPYNHKRVEVPLQHLEVMNMRVLGGVNPKAVSDIRCLDSNVHIVFHDENVAELGICNGIAGSTTKCEGNPETTVGVSGSAKFTLHAVESGATINISKARWEECVRAARDACPTGTMSGTCSGGATSGDVAFVLSNP